jgi:hypothetical protein
MKLVNQGKNWHLVKQKALYHVNDQLRWTKVDQVYLVYSTFLSVATPLLRTWLAEDIKLNYRVYQNSRPFQIHISHNLYCINLTARINERVKTQIV